MTESTGYHEVVVAEGACLALTGDAEQCGNGTDTDASDPEAGLCGVHAGSDVVRVTDFENAAYTELLDEFVDLFRSETEAYALATISSDVEDIWHVLTGLQDVTVGPVEFTTTQACGRARALADHPDLDVDDHPLGVGGCVALQGKSAKNHACPNKGYGTSLLCGMHQEADLRGTVLNDDEPGPELDTVTVDGAEYQLVEQRGDDLIVVDVDEWELRRLDGAAGAETRWSDPETTPTLSDDTDDVLGVVGCGDAKADEPRKAKNLYTSSWSTLKRRYAEEYADEWAVLSAKYGLLDPEVEIEPYDVTADDIDVGEWGVAVAEDLPDVRDTDADDQDDDDVPSWLWTYDGPTRLATYLRENYATTDRAKELAKHFGTVDEFDAANFEEKLRAAGVDGRARNVILDEYDDVADLQYRARSAPALDQLDGVGSQSAHVVGQSFLSWSSTSGAPPQGWNAIVNGEPEIAPDGGPDETVDDNQDKREPLIRPQPADSLPKYLVEGVEKQSPDRLRRLAEYAEQMADYKEEKAQRDLEERAEQDVDTTPDEWDADEWEDVVDDARDEADLAPGKGTLTTKTIDGRDYYYLQWRAGSKIKSQYVAPVTPADSEGSA
jgi:hypothetical protein